MSASQEVREALFAGEELTSKQVGKEWGVSPSILSQVIVRMKQEGHTIVSRNIAHGEKVYRLESKGDHDGFPESSDGQQIPYPEFGAKLLVTGIVQGRKGDVSLQLQNGKHAWKVKIEGVAK